MKDENGFPLTSYPVDSSPINCSFVGIKDQSISRKPIICIDKEDRVIRGYGIIPTEMSLEDVNYDDIIWTHDEKDEEE